MIEVVCKGHIIWVLKIYAVWNKTEYYMNNNYVSSSVAHYHVFIIKTYKLNQQILCVWGKSLIVCIKLKLWHIMLTGLIYKEWLHNLMFELIIIISLF